MLLRRCLLLILLLSSGLSPLAGQNKDVFLTCSSDSCGFVLALSGLKLRERPAFDAKTLALIPFGTQVYRHDPRPTDAEASFPLFSPDSVQGWWEPLRYKGKKGYVFNAFLGRSYWKPTQDFYLIMEDAGYCWSDAFASPAYHYYGLFVNRDSTRAEIKAIKPSFVRNIYYADGVIAHADEKSPSIFLFATREPFAEEGPVRQHHVVRGGSILHNGIERKAVKIPGSTWELSCVVERTKDGTSAFDQNVIQLRDLATGKTQRLIDAGGFASLIWCGDLDRDGVQDFLLEADGIKTGSTLLFLSRNPGKGKIVRLAGQYLWGDCC